MATNLYLLGISVEDAALILRNSVEVVREHYITLQKEGRKVEAMGVFAKTYNECAVPVQ